MAVTFTKLRTGEWGLRITGRAPRPGDVVRVAKKNGTTAVETVGTVVWSGNGVTLATIRKTAPAPKPTPRPVARVTAPVFAPDGPPEPDFDPYGGDFAPPFEDEFDEYAAELAANGIYPAF